MKNLLLMAFMLCGIGMSAQTPVTGISQDTLGYIYGDTLFKDLWMVPVLSFSNNEIRDVAGDIKASYNDSTGVISDVNHDVLFSINSAGNIYGAMGNVIGYIDPGGSIYDINEAYIGNGALSNSVFLAYYFFVYRIM